MAEQSRVIEVPARPAPFQLDPSATAAVVVDMQNDFASPGGMFDRAGIDIAGVQAIVPNVERGARGGPRRRASPSCT